MSNADILAERAREALREVVNPEIGFNIVDIGLVYDLAIENGGGARGTMTTGGCPATNYFSDSPGEVAQSVNGIDWADASPTCNLPWSPETMRRVAKDYLEVA